MTNYELLGRFCGKLNEALSAGVLVVIFDGDWIKVQWEIKIKGKMWIVRQCLSEVAGRIQDPEVYATVLAEQWKEMARGSGWK